MIAAKAFPDSDIENTMRHKSDIYDTIWYNKPESISEYAKYSAKFIDTYITLFTAKTKSTGKTIDTRHATKRDMYIQLLV
jgi:hypothetical protein